jgi:Second Messenger Oligonucleotide or Dinucleotide Synthetase domain
MKLLRHFRAFLEDTVNINATRLGTLSERVSSITNYLEIGPTIGDMFQDVTPQGSMAHRTIIKPQAGKEFDADVLLQLDEQPSWVPKDYIEQTYACFRASNSYRDRVSRKNRCVRVQYAGDLHVDVVPCVTLGDNLYITSRNEGQDGIFERTNPVGYSEWLDDKNRIASNNLVKVIRLFKWIRDYKGTFTCRSVILNALLGGRISDAHFLDDAGYYADVPTTLVHVLEDLVAYLQPYSVYMPRIEDPSCPEVDFNHRWDNTQYLNFRNKISSYARMAREAYDEPNRDKASSSRWTRISGTPPAYGLMLGSSSLRTSDTLGSRPAIKSASSVGRPARKGSGHTTYRRRDIRSNGIARLCFASRNARYPLRTNFSGRSRIVGMKR